MPVKFPDRPITSNTPNAKPKTPPASTGHMSNEVRADLGKLSPELQNGLRKAADAE
jgi:hypothetical protein